MPQRARKRSAAITLVLAGSATLGGCGSPVEQQDAYASLQDCVRDWNNSALCQPVRDGRYSTSYYYGPPYYGTTGWGFFGGSRPQPSPNAMDVFRVERGSVARSPQSALALRTGIAPGTAPSSTARGGFGATGRAFSSSGG
jgi:uncharacterized protein YgiB involved in biofilm formation